MGDSEIKPWHFHFFAVFFFLWGWVSGVTSPVFGIVLHVIGGILVALGILVAVGESKHRKLEQERAEKKRRDDERAKEEARRKDEEMMERWRNRPKPVHKPIPKSYSQILREEERAKSLKEAMESIYGTPVKETEQEWVQNRVRPLAQKFGVSHKGAEELAAEWLRFLGEHRVKTTPYSQDGGADVLTATYCCQVKNYEQKPVSVVEVRALLGTAVSMNLKPLLFTASKPTNAALIFCKETDIAVIEFDAPNALLFGLTPEGHNLLKRGRY